LGKVSCNSCNNHLSSPLLPKIKIYKTVILPVVGFETWSLILREDHRLRMFENGVLRRTFGPKREDGENCIMRSFQGDHMKEDEVGRVYSMHGRHEKCIQSFSHKPEGKRSVGRPRHGWKETIKIDLKEIGCEDVDWMHLTRIGSTDSLM
jgi:hypothetical protein